MGQKDWRPGKRVAVVGGGPGGISAAIALNQQGYDVRVFERQQEPKAMGGAVLLSVPVLAVLRSYGIDIENFGSFTVTEFRNNRGKVRVRLPFNEKVEKAMGIRGWHYGVLRSSAFAKMLERLPADLIVPNHAFSSYEEREDGIVLKFHNGEEVTADLLIGADGVRSRVSEQTFGDLGLFHIGLRLWLAWCDDVPGIDRTVGALHHSRRVQASYFPMLHDGKPGFEWWVVEPVEEGAPSPADVERHLRGLLEEFADPMPRFPDHTNFATQIFRWDIYNRPSLTKWTKGRVACVGDAVHPVSPYAAYGMGMAIEDGYFLARALGGRDLADRQGLSEAFARYESERVKYVNHQVEFARKLGKQFHHAPAPVAFIRDLVFDNTQVLQKTVSKGSLDDAEKMSIQLRELHVANA